MGGGYALASSPPGPTPAEDWDPVVFPDNPGDVVADGPLASIAILNGDEERILLSCIAVNEAPSQREIDRRSNQGAHLARFTLTAVGPSAS